MGGRPHEEKDLNKCNSPTMMILSLCLSLSLFSFFTAVKNDRKTVYDSGRGCAERLGLVVECWVYDKEEIDDDLLLSTLLLAKVRGFGHR